MVELNKDDLSGIMQKVRDSQSPGAPMQPEELAEQLALLIRNAHTGGKNQGGLKIEAVADGDRTILTIERADSQGDPVIAQGNGVLAGVVYEDVRRALALGNMELQLQRTNDGGKIAINNRHLTHSLSTHHSQDSVTELAAIGAGGDGGYVPVEQPMPVRRELSTAARAVGKRLAIQPTSLKPDDLAATAGTDRSVVPGC